MVSPFPAPAFQPMNEMRALIGGDADALHDVIDIFIASVGIIPSTSFRRLPGTS